ncbi:hypothetical protein HPB52_016715 [Rhipicephalus sanguineus]|uniref:CUB domain-containing protein n=1 Tax=Rhipicephalus sanguineus TaxID=34632 RepID=A0A9D4PJH1_RHISA|nr:hypothetical protein HPB52_016715 [Rhipicephalus sanguineus]
MVALTEDLSNVVVTKKATVNGRQSNEEVAYGRHCRNVRKVRLRTVFLSAAVVMLASQATCLQLSIHPQNGSLRARRSRTPYVTIPEPGSVREFRDCGGNLTAFSQPTMLYSPGYPMTYDSDRLCRWVITADQGSVTLRFLNVQIEESPGCGFDSVGVLPGPGQGSAVKLCGAMTNHTIATNSSTVTVVFRSDGSHEEKGFSLEFYAEIDANGLAEECGDALVGKRGIGIVMSPGYPLQYPHKSSCWTLINVDPGRVIVMRFKDLALEADELCTFDYVEIFNGPSEDSPSFGRFCTDSQQRTLRSTTSSVLVHFKSDDFTSSRGFLLEYKSASVGLQVSHEGGCMVTSGFENGTVASPGYPNNYPALARCLIDLKAPREANVALRFVDFSVEQEAQCHYDFVEIWDRQKDGWQSMGRLCGDKEEIAELVSSENRMRVEFDCDNLTEWRGFVANFRLVFPQDRPKAAEGNTIVTLNRTLVPALKLMQDIPGGVAVAQDDEALLNCIPKVPGSGVTWYETRFSD